MANECKIWSLVLSERDLLALERYVEFMISVEQLDM
jgi:hypothetical protein